MVLNFPHQLQERCGDLAELTPREVCEADEIYVTAGEKGHEQAEARDRGLKNGRGSFESGQPPVVSLVRRADGRTRFLAREDLQDIDEAIAEASDGSVMLCTDGYEVYDGNEESDGFDAHLAVTHADHLVLGDAQTNSCENRHSFVRQ